MVGSPGVVGYMIGMPLAFGWTPAHAGTGAGVPVHDSHRWTVSTRGVPANGPVDLI